MIYAEPKRIRVKRGPRAGQWFTATERKIQYGKEWVYICHDEYGRTYRFTEYEVDW